MDEGTNGAANGTTTSGPAVNGTGGRMDDDALRRALEERMREMDQDDEDGMHL